MTAPTSRRPPPTFEEIVARFELDLLNAPADLTIRGGKIALTKRGDLMLNDPRYAAMCRLVERWRFNEPTLEFLFNLVLAAKESRRDLGEARNRHLADLAEFMVRQEETPDHEYARYHLLNDEVAATEFSSAAYAGAVILVLHDLLRSFWDDWDAGCDVWAQSGVLIEGHSFGVILAAAANNFRHSDEWAKTRPPDKRQLASIKVLAAVLGEPLSADGRHRLSRDVCPEILHVLSDGQFNVLARRLFEFARSMTPPNAGA